MIVFLNIYCDIFVTLIKMVLKRAYNFCFDTEMKRIITESLNYLGFPFLSGALKMNMFMYLKRSRQGELFGKEKCTFSAFPIQKPMDQTALFQLFPFKSLWAKMHFFSLSHAKDNGPKCTFSACPMQKTMDQNAPFQLFPFKSLWA